MPSSNNPSTSVAAGAGKLSAGTVPATALTFPSGGGAGAALSAHINDPLNAHMASAIGYLGGSAWVDGTTNPAANVEVQLDKIITDLIATAGAARLGAASTGNFADGAPATGSAIQALINNIVSRLAATAGAARVGATSTGNFADGAPAAGATIQALINDVVARLAATAGAARVGSVNTGNFADGNPATGATIQALINSVVSLLAATAGATRVGSAAYSPGGHYALSAGAVRGHLTALLDAINDQYTTRLISSTTTLTTEDATIIVDNLGGGPPSDITINLPDPAGCTGQRVNIIALNEFTAVKFILLNRFAAEKINGVAADMELKGAFGRWVLDCDGTDWYVAYDGPENRFQPQLAAGPLTSEPISIWTDLVLVDTSGGAVSMALPDPGGANRTRVIRFKDIGGALSTTALTLELGTATAIEGVAANFTFDADYGKLALWSDGGQWWVV